MSEKLDAIVTGINSAMGWVQIITHGSKYSCDTKTIDGELFFKFKEQWHRVSDYITDNTTELIKEGSKLITRNLGKR